MSFVYRHSNQYGCRNACLKRDNNYCPDEVKDWLADLGYDSTYGARPLKRTIQRYLINPLSQALLMEKFSKGDTIRVEIGEKGMLMFSLAAD
jgi:ATP-dependent Clp protease ATP-binding subunit ClpA